jgi:hypothetical protein
MFGGWIRESFIVAIQWSWTRDFLLFRMLKTALIGGGTGKHLSKAREWAIPLGDAS